MRSPPAVELQVGDAVAGVLASAPDGLACTALARTVRRRDETVRAVLHADSRFTRSGVGRGTRWHLHDAHDGARDGLGRIDAAQAGVRAMIADGGAWWASWGV